MVNGQWGGYTGPKTLAPNEAHIKPMPISSSPPTNLTSYPTITAQALCLVMARGVWENSWVDGGAWGESTRGTVSLTWQG